MIILLFFKVVLQSVFAVTYNVLCLYNWHGVALPVFLMGLYGKIVHVHQALSFT